jgi:hypothetical protein
MKNQKWNMENEITDKLLPDCFIALTGCDAGRKCASLLFTLLFVRILMAIVGRILRGIVEKREYQLTVTTSFLRLPAIG